MLRTLVSLAVTLGFLTAQGWIERTPLVGPAPRYEAAMGYDAAHGLVVMYGGRGQGNVLQQDTWIWNGSNWAAMTVSNTPAASTYGPRNTAMAYHAATSSLLLVSAGQIYVWTGSDWLSAGGVTSSNAYDIAMGYDPGRTQTVLFVGTDASNQAMTYVWDGFTWSPRATATRPYPFSIPHMAFDPVANRLLLCTGNTYFWEWTGTNWQQRFPTRTPSVPGAMAGDTLHGRVVMLDEDMTPTANHTWSIANGSCTQLFTPIEPARRQGACMTFDSGRGVCVLYGGSNAFPMGDLWEFNLGYGPGYSTYGSGCSGSRGVPTIGPQNLSVPRVGQPFSLNATNLPLTGPVFLFLGLSDTNYGATPLPFGLAGIGAPACSILCSADAIYLLPNVLGSSIWSFPVPALPGATFFNQVFALDTAANVLGLTTSNAGRGMIGL